MTTKHFSSRAAAERYARTHRKKGRKATVHYDSLLGKWVVTVVELAIIFSLIGALR